MNLTDSEKAMLDGREGKARQKAMELLVRYAEALGAERFVDTNNVAGVPGSANPFLQNYYKDKGAERARRDLLVLRSRLRRAGRGAAGAGARPAACRAAPIRDNWETLGTKPEVFKIYKDREAFAAEPRREDPEDLHAVPRRQRAGEGRALRVDGDRRPSSTATRCSARAPTPKGARARAPRC